MNVTVEIRRDEATRDVALVHDRLTNPAQRQAMMKVIGVRAEKELRSWFRKKDDDSPNKMGWPRQHFWSRLARATAFDPSKTTQDSTTVTVADPALAAKISGATIRATGAISPATGKPTRNLAIPMQAAVYGSWPRGNPIAGLFFLRTANGAFLVTRDGKNLTFYYRLVPQVTVPKDPTALPPAGQLGAALGETALQFFRRNGGPN